MTNLGRKRTSGRPELRSKEAVTVVSSTALTKGFDQRGEILLVPYAFPEATPAMMVMRVCSD
jgi:hypothetical protein